MAWALGGHLNGQSCRGEGLGKTLDGGAVLGVSFGACLPPHPVLWLAPGERSPACLTSTPSGPPPPGAVGSGQPGQHGGS